MPIYEFTCGKCLSRFEKLVRSMAVPVEVTCPECGSADTKKGWSIFGTGKPAGDRAGLTAPEASSCSPTGT